MNKNPARRPTEPPSNADVLTLPEAAAVLRTCTETVRRHIKNGTIPAFRVGRVWRIRRKDLLGPSEWSVKIKWMLLEQFVEDVKAIAIEYNIPIETSSQRKDVAAVDLRQDVIFALRQIPDGQHMKLALTVLRSRHDPPKTG